MFYEFNGYRPVVHESAYVHPQACITGNVIIGKDVFIGPGAAIRGDWGEIIIEDGCNVQENCTIHMFPGVTTRLKKGAHIGHGAIVHGATIGENCLIAAGAVVLENSVLEPGHIYAGVPAKKVKAIPSDIFSGTVERIANNYLMYAGWFKE